MRVQNAREAGFPVLASIVAHRHRHRRRLTRQAVQVAMVAVVRCVLQRRAYSVPAGAPLQSSVRVSLVFSAMVVVDAGPYQRLISERLARVHVKMLQAQPGEVPLSAQVLAEQAPSVKVLLAWPFAALPGGARLSVQGLAGLPLVASVARVPASRRAASTGLHLLAQALRQASSEPGAAERSALRLGVFWQVTALPVALLRGRPVPDVCATVVAPARLWLVPLMRLRPWQPKLPCHRLAAFAAQPPFAAPRVCVVQAQALAWQRQVLQAASRGSWINSAAGHCGVWVLPVSGFAGLGAHQSAASARHARRSHRLLQVPELIALVQAGDPP